MSSEETTPTAEQLGETLGMEGGMDLSAKIEPGPEPWTWLLTVISDGHPLHADLERRHLQMSDLEVMLQGDFVDRSIPGGGILLMRKVDDNIRLRIVAPEDPQYCPPNGYLGDIPWSRLVESVNSLEKRRKQQKATLR